MQASEEPSGTGLTISAGHLFGVAREACSRALGASPDTHAHVSHDPLVAVVFAAAAGEAFINELADVAAHPAVVDRDLGPEPPEVGNLISLLSEAEGNRAATGFKFLVGKLALARNTYDKGANPYQDFATLIELRNSLLHLRTEHIEGVLAKGRYPSYRHPPVLERLRSKQILVDVGGGGASWLYLVSTAATAKWACNATANIVADLFSSMPDSQLKAKVQLFYYQHGAFDPVV
jgi:hypothetical protein